MEMKELGKEWRIWVLAFALIVSTVLLIPWDSPTLFFDTSGDEIGFKTNLDDRTSIEFSGGTRMLLELQTNATGQELNQLAEEVRSTLELRLNSANIPDPSVRTVDIGGGNWRVQVESATTDQERLREIVEREGSFESRMPILVRDQKDFSLDEYTYSFERDGETVSVEGQQNNFSVTVEPEERFVVEENGVSGHNTTFVHTGVNESKGSAVIEAVVYNGEEIVDIVESDSEIRPQGNGFEFRLPVSITQEAAQNRLHISENYQARSLSGPGSQQYLAHEDGSFARSGLYVDGKEESRLLMASVFAQSPETSSTISGPGETREAAVNARDDMISILESGRLPVSLDVVSVSNLSSSLGAQFMSAAIFSIIAALIAVGVLVFIRYKDPRVVVPLVLTGASEVYILLGAYFTTIGTLSLSAVAGIIAAVGTGVDDQIIITDESGKQELGGWQKKMKRAFFVIFTSAASTIGAMSPILAPSAVSYLIGAAGLGLIGYTFYTRGTDRHYVAIGVFAVIVSAITASFGPSGAALSTIHEFAKTTILGILVGIAITRPAYAKTLEYIKE